MFLASLVYVMTANIITHYVDINTTLSGVPAGAVSAYTTDGSCLYEAENGT